MNIVKHLQVLMLAMVLVVNLLDLLGTNFIVGAETAYKCLDSPAVPAEMCYCEDSHKIDTACDVDTFTQRPFTCELA